MGAGENSRMEGVSSMAPGNSWVWFAEDAEKRAEDMRIRSKMMAEAARIFRYNIDNEVPFPSPKLSRYASVDIEEVA